MPTHKPTQEYSDSGLYYSILRRVVDMDDKNAKEWIAVLVI